MATLYAAARSGTDAVLPRLSRTYADFAREQRAYLESPAAVADWEFWKTCLDTPPPGIELMSGTARGPADPTVGLTIRKPFGAQRMAQLESWARDHETTPFAVMFGLYALLLSRCSGRDDVVIGMPTAGRNNPENEDLVGHFVNTLPVRARVDGAATMRAWIVEFSSTVRSALAHQDFPFTEMVRRIAPDRQAGRSPFFQHMFNWNQRRGAGLDTFGRVRLPTSNGIGGASHELTLTVAQERDDWQTVWSFSTASVESWFVDELCSSLEYLVDQLIDNPDRKLRDAQLVQLVPEESGDVDESVETIDRMVSRQADRTPGAPAVASAQGGVTYRQLMNMAGRITAGLQQAGVVPGDRVAVMLDRHADLIATLLGIMQAGAAYVPLDPSYPEDRLDFILDDSCPRLLVVDRLDA